MIYNTEIEIDEAVLFIDIDYDYFKEDGEVTIRINSIMNGKMEISELIPADKIEDIRYKCQRQYENNMFNEIELLMNKTWYGMDNSKEEL